MRRAFAGVDLADLDPFIHMDQMGEVDYAPGEPQGTDWHPHRGFETVTYMIDGTFQHQDSHGGGGVITNGATQWMTAGGGILHIETPPEELVVSGGLFHGIQLWVNLPAKHKMVAPRYQNLDADQVAAAVARPTAARWCASSPATSAGHAGPGSTHTPITRGPRHLAAGARLVAAVAGRLQRPRLRARRQPAPSAPSAVRSRPASSSCSAPATSLTLEAGRPTPARRAAARRPADPRAGRRLRPVRHEHPRRAGDRGRGLPGRPARHRPGRRPAARLPAP